MSTAKITPISEGQAREILGNAFWGRKEVIDLVFKKGIKSLFPKKKRISIPPIIATPDQLRRLKNKGFGLMLCMRGELPLSFLTDPLKQRGKNFFSYVESQNTKVDMQNEVLKTGGIDFLISNAGLRDKFIETSFTWNKDFRFVWKVISLKPLDLSGKTPLFKIRKVLDLCYSLFSKEIFEANHKFDLPVYREWLSDLIFQKPDTLFFFLKKFNYDPAFMRFVLDKEEFKNSQPEWAKIMQSNTDLREMERAVNGAIDALTTVERHTENMLGKFTEGAMTHNPKFKEFREYLVSEIIAFTIIFNFTPDPNALAFQHVVRLINAKSEKELVAVKENSTKLTTFYPLSDDGLVGTFWTPDVTLRFYEVRPTESYHSVPISFDLSELNLKEL